MERANISKREYEKGGFSRMEYSSIFSSIFSSFYPSLLSYLNKKKLRKKIEEIHLLLKNNKDFFIQNWGKQDFVLTSEYKHYAWSFNFPNGIMIVFTGNRGTSYEFSGNPNKEDYNFFIEFIQPILSQELNF